MQKPTLISCLCVTHHKPQLLKRAIACFNSQSYKSKQLVIVYEETDILTCTYIQSHIFASNIKLVAISGDLPKLMLGELRNRSIKEADGEYVCQWDDDDWYSCDRLEIQMNYLQKNEKQASVLLRWIIFDSLTQKSYLSFAYPWEGSLLCRKELLEAYPYPALGKGEDSPVVKALIADEHVAFIPNEPEIYVYNFHGANTWDEQHFQGFINLSIELPEETNKEIIACITH